ncbi:hypothetical protein AK812_SmicGene1589 [Symbiodinium microadriaticum]|uniref:Glycosyl transferase family 25 domain-containing protein n=1 Tax=Symbiodinium microadriaticum TaxID=2951 RepID=A0A1Q9F3N9_SYMMI|nr:hypothetical protein AK812_SmicGene1589 [Symbiodinium microadriaticum]
MQSNRHPKRRWNARALDAIVGPPPENAFRRKDAEAPECAIGLHDSLQVLRAAAVNGSNAVTQAVHSLSGCREVFADLPQVQHALSLRLAASCDQAGGQKVVLGAAAAGWTGGLCLGTLLWSGESPESLKRLADAIELAHQRNRTAAVRTKLRRGLRRRLLTTSAASAAAAAYLCTLPTPLEGGTGLVARASGVARRMGLATTAFQTKLMERPPLVRQRRRWHLSAGFGFVASSCVLRAREAGCSPESQELASGGHGSQLLEGRSALWPVDADSTLRAAVVTGTGKAFAAGADIKDANLSDELVLEGWLQQPLLVYFINTDSSTARRAHIEQQGKDLGLPLQRFRAIDTTDIASGRFDAAYVSRQGLDPLLLSSGPDRSINGTVACFVSHASLMEQIARNYSGDRVALVLEDDVLLPTDLLQRLEPIPPRSLPLMKIALLWRGLLVGVADI